MIAERGRSPTDLYIIEGAMKSAGRHVERRLTGANGPSIEALIDDNVAVVVLSHVDYRTGELLDIAGITRRIHDAGVLVVWDLCHSAGVVDIGFDRHAIDFAVGCTYKYLNGGPGSPAFIYVAKAHLAAAQQPLSGWWGHAAPFAFDRDFRPDAGIKRFLCGTQPIISMRGVDVALDAIRRRRTGGVAIEESRSHRTLHRTRQHAIAGADIVTPHEPALRGSQIGSPSIEDYAVVQAMIERGAIGDFRAPNLCASASRRFI